VTQLPLDYGSDGLTHLLLPNFAIACGIDFLDRPAAEKVAFKWIGKGITCPWCHALGRRWYERVIARQQGKAA
jgi:hypothetical protein